MKTALVIGAGPAGLMAADTLAQAGVQVTIAEKMPSVGRKFLMAGKSGLNITKAEAADKFASKFHPAHDQFTKAVEAFGPHEVQTWASDLGEALFVGSTGRVFPKVMKASPLLRAWLRRLTKLGVTIQTRWIWTGWSDGHATFDTPSGPVEIKPDATVLALGGASWARLGSDGAWIKHIPQTAPFKPANVGFRRNWSEHMDAYIGHPVKGITLKAGGLVSRGEIVLNDTGLEGGGIYEVSRAIRDGGRLTVDLVPDLTAETLAERWSRKPRKGTLSKFLKNTLRLSSVKIALWYEVTKSRGPLSKSETLRLIKDLPIALDGPKPIDEAISTAGGVRFNLMTDELMLRDHPGVFCAGEMLDWEAPTGGYLITGCLATGRLAALGALRWVNKTIPS